MTIVVMAPASTNRPDRPGGRDVVDVDPLRVTQPSAPARRPPLPAVPGAWKESRARILRKRRWSATCSFSVPSHHALAVTLVTEKANVDPAECPLLILRLLNGEAEFLYVSNHGGGGRWRVSA